MTYGGAGGLAGTGTVTSVALSLPAEFSVSGSPVTASGTLTATWASTTAKRTLADATRVVTASGDVTVLTTDTIVILNKTTSDETTVYLPASPTANDQYIVKDGAGNAATYAITVTTTDDTTLDGETEHVMRRNYQSRTFVYNGAEWNVI